jgi:HD-GYP domain-containing protein (c-di-GMP phosphodiesterase class II)
MQSILAEPSVYDEKLLAASTAADDFQGYASGHSRRVADLVDALGRAMNLDGHDRFFLQQAALVRNAGELEMNRDYMGLPRALTADERLDLQRHPVIAEQWCAKNGISRGVQLIVRWHHEWWNGGGYPDGLEGGQIPLAARVLRLADTYSALTAKRHFREAVTSQAARRYLVEWAGIEFDPAAVQALLSLPAVGTD